MDSPAQLGPPAVGRVVPLAPAGVLLPFDEAVAVVWGQLQARGQHRGRPRPVNDTWVAACCLVHGIALATFNVKDYTDFATHEGLQLVDAGPGPVRP